MGHLTCGAGGSTGAEIVTAINANEDGLVDMDTRVDALENAPEQVDFYGAKIAAYAVPDAYAGDAITLSVVGIRAGRYLISYAIQLNFGTQKDKEVAYQTTGDIAGDELSQSMGLASTIGRLSTNYSYYLDTVGGDFSFGMRFRDVATGKSLVVDYCDLMLMRVGDTPLI